VQSIISFIIPASNEFLFGHKLRLHLNDSGLLNALQKIVVLVVGWTRRRIVVVKPVVRVLKGEGCLLSGIARQVDQIEAPSQGVWGHSRACLDSLLGQFVVTAHTGAN
jgi:hypothetical protein